MEQALLVLTGDAAEFVNEFVDVGFVPDRFCGSQSLGVVSTSVLLESSVRVRSLLRSLAELLIVPMAVKVRWVRISPNDGAV